MYEVKITQNINTKHQFTTTAEYDTYEEALEYAQIKRDYKCRIRIIYKHVVEEVVYELSM